MKKLAQARKALAPIAVGAMAWATLVVHSRAPGVTPDEWLIGAGYLLSALGVYTITNAPTPASP